MMAPRKRKNSAAQMEDSVDGPLNSKRPRVEEESGSVHLLDLPLGPLHLIISKVHPSNQTLLRRTSKQLRLEHSDCVLHNYKSVSNLHLRHRATANDEEMMVHIVMEVLAHSTNYFINSGYDAVFTGKLLQFHKQLTTGEELLNVTQMHQFLHEFYHNLEWSAAKDSLGVAARKRLNQRRLIHTMTLLNLIRQFRKFRKISSGMNLMHWQLQLEVLGVYFGVHDREATALEEEKLVDFLTIIAELLVFDKSNQSVNRFIEIGNNFYVYGIKDQTVSTRCPKLLLKLSVLAPLALRNLLENALNGKVDMGESVHCPILDTFSIQLEVKSSQANVWGSNNTMDICIVPLT